MRRHLVIKLALGAVLGFTLTFTTPAFDLPNFGKVNDHYYRGAQPRADQYDELADLGIKTVIDLRDDARSYAKGSAERVGLRYINLPLNDKRRPPEDAAR